MKGPILLPCFILPPSPSLPLSPPGAYPYVLPYMESSWGRAEDMRMRAPDYKY